jgi:hypothetical protein
MDGERSLKPTDNPCYIDIAELSRRTGLSVSTIRRLKEQGNIPCYQPAGKCGKLLFPVDAIERSAGQPPVSDPADTSGHFHASSGRLSGPAPAWMRSCPIETEELHNVS